MATPRQTKKTATKRVKAAVKKATTTKKATKRVTAKKLTDKGFKVAYAGLASKIFSQTVNKGKYPRGVHPTLAAAKKDIVTRIKADTKKAVDRVLNLKTVKSVPSKTK